MPHSLRTVPFNSFTSDTIREMYRHVADGIADPKTIAEARAVARRVPIRNDRALAEALLKDTKQRVRYVRDPIGVEAVSGLDWMRRVKAGDCDEQSIWLASHAAAVGIPARFVTLKVKQPHNFDHVYTELFVDGKWLGADPAVAKSVLGWEPPKFYEKKIWHDPRLRTREGLRGLGIGGHMIHSIDPDDSAMEAATADSFSRSLGEPYWESSFEAATPTRSEYEDTYSAHVWDATHRGGSGLGLSIAQRSANYRGEKERFRRERKNALDKARVQMKKELRGVKGAQRAALKRQIRKRMGALRRDWATRRDELAKKIRTLQTYVHDGYMLPINIARRAGVGQDAAEVGEATVSPFERATGVTVTALDNGPDPDPSKNMLVHAADLEAAAPEIAEALGPGVREAVQAEVRAGKTPVSGIKRRMEALASIAMKKVARPVRVQVAAVSTVPELIDEALREEPHGTAMQPYHKLSPVEYAAYRKMLPLGMGQFKLDQKTLVTWGIPIAAAFLVLPRLLGGGKKRRR